MSKYDVVIKRVDALRVVSVRAVVPTPPEQGVLWEEVGKFLATQPGRASGACLTLYHDSEYREQDWDVEVCQPVVGDMKEAGRVKVQTLPAVETMACTLHHGPFTSISEAYEAIVKWIDANGYSICGPSRELVLREPAGNPGGGAVKASQTDPETVIEVQFPVEKAM